MHYFSHLLNAFIFHWQYRNLKLLLILLELFSSVPVLHPIVLGGSNIPSSYQENRCDLE
jgi:hypothetical protein